MAVERMTLAEIAFLLGGAEVVGDPETEIHGIAPIQSAGPGEISFVSNEKYVKQIATTRASACLVSPRVAERPRAEGLALVVLDDPYMGFARLMQHWYHRPRQVRGVSERAYVDPTATLGREVNVEAFAYVGPGARIGDRVDVRGGAYVGENAQVGDDTVIEPGAVLHHDVEVGAHCHIYAGAVIGSDGFGFAPDRAQGLHVKIPQVGRVVLEDHVHVGANVTIDRAALGETRVMRGTKIDNLVQLGHSVRVGMGCFIVSQAGISGTSTIGHGVTIAGQAGVAGHVTVGDGAIIGAQAGVHGDVPPGARMLGSPAIEGTKAKRSMAVFAKLPELRARLRSLERRLEALEGRGCEG
ncbi:MAG: UDP-3-O-(3-hydroxymyristoyl)glucosamine N-acyltransferase [Planctomycetota bacterium]|nr:MAG: UDP-3-O-(3-hydroxymyristoyl)glucosamine N-acyltransferase [Planctomycetota bacterium]